MRACPNLVIEQNVIAESERLIFGDETADKENRDGNEQKAAHHIGDEIESVDESSWSVD